MPTSSPPPTNYSQLKILLIENSPTAAILVEDIFCGGEDAEAGSQIVHCKNLAGGLAELEKALFHRFDIILLDLTLPDSQGVGTVKAMRASTTDIPLLVLTGEDNEQSGMDALLEGADEYLIKDETYPRSLRRHAHVAIQRKAFEVALRKAKFEAEEAAKLKDKFLGMVMHDIRSPLMAITGWSEILEVDARKHESEDIRSAAAHIHRTAEEMHKVVEEFLDISKLQTGKIIPNMGFMDAQFLAGEIIHRIGILAQEKGIELVNEIPPASRVFCDRLLMGQVLQNMVTNAIKFSHSGGKVRLFLAQGKPTTIAVSDEGIGIPVENRSKLFRLGEKISTLGTKGEKGTGYGLPYGHDIMLAMGGSLEVASEPGRGSTFFAGLVPVQPSVLVVDDHEHARDVICQFLKKLGVLVTEAGNGKAALKKLETMEPPHLILSDIVMPEMNGLELLRKLKEHESTAHIPVIMIAGGENIEAREEALRLGALDFTMKPVVMEDFLPRVRRVVG